LFLFNQVILANECPYKNYNYNFWQEAVPAPQAYLLSKVVNGSSLGIRNSVNEF
jgi:hypothetical protein